MGFYCRVLEKILQTIHLRSRLLDVHPIYRHAGDTHAPGQAIAELELMTGVGDIIHIGHIQCTHCRGAEKLHLSALLHRQQEWDGAKTVK